MGESMFLEKIKSGAKTARDYVNCAYHTIPLMKAELAFQKGKYDGLKSIIEPYAQADIFQAQYRLGTMYESGLGVEKDPTQAYYWCEKAAEHGHADSQLLCASFCARGLGTEPDLQKASEWMHLAVSNEEAPDPTHTSAVYMLLFSMWAKKAVDEDPKKASYLCAKIKEILAELGGDT